MEETEFYKQNTLPNLREQTVGIVDLPSNIGPYEVESLLSKGGMSYLYLAKKGMDGLHYAVKVLSPDYLKHPEMAQQFQKEAEIIQMADHQNIIKVYGHGEWDNGLYIAMEYVRGITLRQFILQQSLSLKGAIDIIMQVAYALLHLHTHGIIHRDVKPENILITEEGHVKVCDFGVAQLQVGEKNALSKKGHIVGTPSYMSPELKKDPKKISTQTDIYALGVVAYELITGKFSYGTLQMQQIPTSIRSILEKMLAFDPNDRYEDVVDFINDMNSYIKSGLVEDESGHEQANHLITQVRTSHLELLPFDLPSWNEIEMGLVRSKAMASLGLFYDFIRLPSGNLLLYLGEFHENEIQSLSHIGYLKGCIRSLLKDSLHPPMRLLDKDLFLEELTQLMKEESFVPSFPCMFLFISLTEESFSFASMGMPPLMHISMGSEAPRTLHGVSAPLGVSDAMTWTSDSFLPGDTLLMHTFFSSTKQEKVPDIALHALEKSLVRHSDEAPQTQAEHAYGALLAATSEERDSCSKALLSIQRMM